MAVNPLLSPGAQVQGTLELTRDEMIRAAFPDLHKPPFLLTEVDWVHLQSGPRVPFWFSAAFSIAVGKSLELIYVWQNQVREIGTFEVVIAVGAIMFVLGSAASVISRPSSKKQVTSRIKKHFESQAGR